MDVQKHNDIYKSSTAEKTTTTAKHVVEKLLAEGGGKNFRVDIRKIPRMYVNGCDDGQQRKRQ
jgi:hypothetical protein